MGKSWWLRITLYLAVFGLAGVGYADDLSIYDIQSYTSDGDASIYDEEIHNCSGGIVTHIWQGFNKRVYLQHPDHPTWGAIVVKDGEGGELADNVEPGDWVWFENIYVQESFGTTFLQYRRSDAPDVVYHKRNTQYPVPDPTEVWAETLAAPVEVTPGQWSVTDRRSEPYESMVLTMVNLGVGETGLGWKNDNYELWQGTDVAWGTDYMNIDAGGPYHPMIYTGAELASITGVLEQTLDAGWDYYQLNTRFGSDIVPEPGTLTLLLAGMVVVRRRRYSASWRHPVSQRAQQESGGR